MDLKQLRRQLRQLRRALSFEQQMQHARLATAHALRSGFLQRSKRIAVFLAQDGELSTEYLIRALWQRQREVVLPMVQAQGRLQFAPYQPHSVMQANRFGIAEPQVGLKQRLRPQTLEVVFVPLVGFDAHGQRLGMGGGFYDRSFAFRNHGGRKPLLIGWAHGCQEVALLDARPWDVRLDGIVTEKGVRWFR